MPNTLSATGDARIVDYSPFAGPRINHLSPGEMWPHIESSEVFLSDNQICELFCGVGGMALGFALDASKSVGVRVTYVAKPLDPAGILLVWGIDVASRLQHGHLNGRRRAALLSSPV